MARQAGREARRDADEVRTQGRSASMENTGVKSGPPTPRAGRTRVKPDLRASMG